MTIVSNNEKNEFKKIVIDKTPLIDVRAPIEYHKGAFLNSINLPLMNDDERHLVGLCYKERGKEEAMLLGHKLVSGDNRDSRINSWISYIEKNPDSLIYCFRGGSRSAITQQWIYESTGIKIPRIEGGYKAFRNYLLGALNPAEQHGTPIILGGYTGAGKTVFLREYDNFIDLENIANHRGSTFGRHIHAQPTQINFENNLAYALIQHKHEKHKYMLLEDEGRHVGKCFIPQDLVDFFNTGILVVLDASLDERIENTINEYVFEAQTEYLEEFGNETGLFEWAKYIRSSINKIEKRLGGECHKRLLDTFDSAFKTQIEIGSCKSHEEWIQILLLEYYDPMYYYQIEKKKKDISFQGNKIEVMEYLKSINL